MWKDFDTNKKLKVKKEITNKKKNKKAILFFPFWTGKSSIYRKVAKKFPNYTLVFYDYPNEILSEDVKVSLGYLKEILDDSIKLIKQLRKEGYEEITLVGSSIGSNIVIRIATKVEVDKLVLNMVDRTVAREIFDSSALRILKRKLIKHGFEKEKIDKIYRFISTEYIVNKIKNKNKLKILLFTSDTDIFCTTEELKPVIEEFKENNIDYKIKTNKFLGHILSIYTNLFFNKEIVNFIKEK